MKTIKFTYTKRGTKKAYYFGQRAMRWLPMPVAEAEHLIAVGQAELVPADAL